VLGVHIIGPSASDLIPEGVVAMHLEATLDDIADIIHAHPTLGESTMEAAHGRPRPPRPYRPTPQGPPGRR
jgi:dihydrolipoamide dehydrogenase